MLRADGSGTFVIDSVDIHPVVIGIKSFFLPSSRFPLIVNALTGIPDSKSRL
jgi:hypothetical protein